MVLGDAPLDRIDVRPRVHEPPHRIRGLLGRLRRRPPVERVDQRELEPFDLVLRGPVALRP
jgi:hypothetical protein